MLLNSHFSIQHNIQFCRQVNKLAFTISKLESRSQYNKTFNNTNPAPPDLKNQSQSNFIHQALSACIMKYRKNLPNYRLTSDPKSSRNSSFRCENVTRWSRSRSLWIARSNTVISEASSISGWWYSTSISCRYSFAFSCHTQTLQLITDKIWMMAGCLATEQHNMT